MIVYGERGEKMLKDKKWRNSIFLLFILFLPVSWASLSVGSIYRLITIGLFAIFILANNFKIYIPKEKKKLFYAWSIYVLYTLLTIIWGGFTSQQITIALGMVVLYAISIVFVGSYVDMDNVKMIDYAWIAASLIFIILFFTGSRTSLGWSSRQSLVIMGTPTDANEFASFFAVAISVAIIHFLNAKKILIKVGFLAVVLCGFYVVLMSGSRGALIATAISVLITLFVGKRLKFKGLILIIIFGLVAWIIVANYIINLIPENTLSRISVEAIINDSGSGRSHIWTNAVNVYWNGSLFNIIFGYGYGSIDVSNGFGTTTNTMHNQFLQNLVSYGIVGFLLYIRLLFVVFKEYIRNKSDYIGCFLGIMVMSLTITMGTSYKILWIILMIPMLTYCNEKSNER